jgi:hypothetical protein
MEKERPHRNYLLSVLVVPGADNENFLKILYPLA